MQVFFEAFSREEYQAYLEWERKEAEAVVVHVSYSALFQCGNANVKQFLEYLYEHPQDLIQCLGLALDSVRLYVMGLADQRLVVVRQIFIRCIGPLHKLQPGLLPVDDQVAPYQQVCLPSRHRAEG